MTTLHLTFRIDPRTRFPLVEVPGENFALFWLPLTKVQAEYFLSDALSRQFDRAWYRERLRANPRVTAEKLIPQHLTRAFLTDITFYEARAISQWYGRGSYDLPSAEEWQRALHIFETIPADPVFVQQIIEQQPQLHPRARLLIQACEEVLPASQHMRDPSARRLSHQLMMSLGLLEYVYQDATHTRSAACGSPLQGMRPSSAGQSGSIDLLHPNEGDRMVELGVRPLLRL